jgi:hypothetical protein
VQNKPTLPAVPTLQTELVFFHIDHPVFLQSEIQPEDQASSAIWKIQLLFDASNSNIMQLFWHTKFNNLR